MDSIDLKILAQLQRSANIPLTELSRRVGLSKTPCWNRIRRMEENGIITGQIMLLDRQQIGLPVAVFLSVSVSRHSSDWLTRFQQLIDTYDNIIEVHRLTGNGADYLLKIVSSSIEAYDIFQQELIEKIEFTSMSSAVSLQQLKYRTSLPLGHLEAKD